MNAEWKALTAAERDHMRRKKWQPPPSTYNFCDVQRQYAVRRATQYWRPVILHIYPCAAGPLGVGSSMYWTTRAIKSGEKFEVYFPDGSYLRCRKK